MAKAYLEPEDIAKLENACTKLRDKLRVHTLFHLGCRISEALALIVENIDFQGSYVNIQHLKTRLHLSCPHCATGLGRSHSFCPKCGSKVSDAVAHAVEHRRQRILPIDNQTLKLLKEYIDSGGPVARNGSLFIFGITVTGPGK